MCDNIDTMTAIALNLTDTGVRGFLQRLGPAGRATVSMMERRESWAVDGDPRAEQVMEELGKTLTRVPKEQVIKCASEDPESFIHLMALMRSSRSMMVLWWLIEISPDLDALLLARHSHAPSRYSAVLYSRLQAFDRLSILSRIFEKSRVMSITSILEEVAERQAKQSQGD